MPVKEKYFTATYPILRECMNGKVCSNGNVVGDIRWFAYT